MEEARIPRQSTFQVGQEVEVKSFIKGYRGAWFKCKIEEIKMLNCRVRFSVRYLDFEDERPHTMFEYQVNPYISKNPKVFEHMVRPLPLTVIRKANFNIDESYENVIVLEEDWKVGDEAEWWYSSCWWECIIVKIIDDNYLLVVLPKPPMGEGEEYKVLKTTLRPALIWTNNNTWVTSSKVFANGLKDNLNAQLKPKVQSSDFSTSIIVPKWFKLRQLMESMSKKGESGNFIKDLHHQKF